MFVRSWNCLLGSPLIVCSDQAGSVVGDEDLGVIGSSSSGPRQFL